MIQPRTIALAQLFGAVLCGAACAPAAQSPDDGAALKRREAARVRVTPVAQREMLRVTSTTTNVESVNEITIYPRTAGVVAEVLAEEGDRVEKGAVLATLDAREAQAALEDAQVALLDSQNALPRLKLAIKEAEERSARARLAWEQARRELERNIQAGLLSEVDLDKLRLASDTGERDFEASKLTVLGAQQDLDKQSTVIERARLSVKSQELALSYTEICSPFDGVVAERMIKAGDAVTAASGVFIQTDPDHLRAVVYRPQRELGFFQGVGSESSIGIICRPDALLGHEYSGQILFISPTIDETSGSFKITIQLEQPPRGAAKPRLMPGMLIRLDIVTERREDARVVPKRALRREGELSFLFVVRDGLASQVQVEEGFSDDQYVEILPVEPGALKIGDEVVVVGNRDLEDGSTVLIEQPEPSTTPGEVGNAQ